MESSVFRVERRAVENLQVLAPSGRITLGHSARELRRAMDQVAIEGHQWLLLDMTAVPYVDSAGLGAIVIGLNQFRKAQGGLLLAGVQPRIAQMLDLTSLTGVLQVFPNERAALLSVPRQAPPLVQ